MFAFIFGGISRLFHKWDAVCIDNHVFRLHYRGTVIIFLAAIALVSCYVVMIIMLIVMAMKAIMIRRSVRMSLGICPGVSSKF